jgi:hypothetical protein
LVVRKENLSVLGWRERARFCQYFNIRSIDVNAGCGVSGIASAGAKFDF